MCGHIFLYWSVCSVCRRQHREMLCILWCGQRFISGEYEKSSKLEKFYPVFFVSLLFQVRPQQGPGIGEGALCSEQKGENRARSATDGCWTTSLPVFLCMRWSPTAGLCSSAWPRLCPHTLCLNSPRSILSLVFHAFVFLQAPPFLFLMTHLP